MKRLLANCLVLLLTSGLATGQRPRGSPKRLAVDVVSVKGGPQLFGAVLSRSADGGLTMAVERAWLEKTYPRYYQELAAGERALATAAREGLTRRIERWQRRRRPGSLLYRPSYNRLPDFSEPALSPKQSTQHTS